MTGGLWPAELSTVTAETAAFAAYLKADLERIANSANDELKIIKRAGMPDLARQAQEARIIDAARARAVRRVESTIRHLHAVKAEAAAGYSRLQLVEPAGPDLHETQVIPAITDVEPSPDAVTQRGRHHAMVDEPEVARHPDPASVAARTAQMEDTQVIPAVTEAKPDAATVTAAERRRQTTDSGRHHAVVDEPEALSHPAPTPAATRSQPQESTAATESDIDRLYRILEFVVRQEPRVNWAVGDRLDGTTVLVTDLAHGWIPSGITLPAGVRLLDPERRTGRASALIGETRRVVTYAPGDSLHRSADFATTTTSLQPRKLPAIEDLARVLSQATRSRHGLPRIANRLAEAAAAGSGIVDQEVDVLRVHLDTARYQLVVQYPEVNPGLLLDCLLLAATEGIVSGDSVSANYHLAWYQELAPPPGSR